MRKRIPRGKGAPLRSCSSTRATSTYGVVLHQLCHDRHQNHRELLDFELEKGTPCAAAGASGGLQVAAPHGSGEQGAREHGPRGSARLTIAWRLIRRCTSRSPRLHPACALVLLRSFSLGLQPQFPGKTSRADCDSFVVPSRAS
jgi:hypothetical protein